MSYEVKGKTIVPEPKRIDCPLCKEPITPYPFAKPKGEDHVSRVANPAGYVLLDLNVLQAWSRDDLRQLGERARVVVPAFLLREVITKDDKRKAIDCLVRLENMRFVLAERFEEQLLWELEHLEPVGLLLDDSLRRGFPELSAAEFMRRYRSTAGGAPLDSEFEGLVERLNQTDKSAERGWEESSRKLTERLNARETVARDIRKRDRGEVFARLTEEAQRRSIIKDNVNRLRVGLGKKHGMDLGPVPLDFVERVDHCWILDRWFRAQVLYPAKNSLDNPSQYNHKRLNQRMDLYYLAMLHPTMTLATRDKEMIELASFVSPGSKVISDPSDAL